MAITPTQFKDKFPEFAAVDDARIQDFIDETEIILNISYWGDKYDLGQYYLTAHLLATGNYTEAGSVGSRGLVGGKAVDGTSISYTNPTPNNQSDAFYASTIYGQRYLTLRKSLGVPASVV